MDQKTLIPAAVVAALLATALVGHTAIVEPTTFPPAPGSAPVSSQPPAPPVPAAAATATAPPAPAQVSAPTTSVGPEAAIEAQRKAYEQKADTASRRGPRPERPTEPEAMPTREELDRYSEQRRMEVDAQMRAMDPWGQARRDWLEGRRQFRRGTLDLYRATPGFGGYPWGPIAPYHGGAPWGEPVAPLPPSREAMDRYFEQQHRAWDQQVPGGARWTPYMGDAYGARPGSAQDRMLLQNPWALEAKP